MTLPHAGTIYLGGQQGTATWTSDAGRNLTHISTSILTDYTDSTSWGVKVSTAIRGPRDLNGAGCREHQHEVEHRKSLSIGNGSSYITLSIFSCHPFSRKTYAGNPHSSRRL